MCRHHGVDVHTVEESMWRRRRRPTECGGGGGRKRRAGRDGEAEGAAEGKVGSGGDGSESEEDDDEEHFYDLPDTESEKELVGGADELEPGKCPPDFKEYAMPKSSTEDTQMASGGRVKTKSQLGAAGSSSGHDAGLELLHGVPLDEHKMCMRGGRCVRAACSSRDVPGEVSSSANKLVARAKRKRFGEAATGGKMAEGEGEGPWQMKLPALAAHHYHPTVRLFAHALLHVYHYCTLFSAYSFFSLTLFPLSTALSFDSILYASQYNRVPL